MTTLTGLILLVVIVTALIFTLTNGLHDASSVVATFIASGAGNPVQGIVLAAVFGLLGAITGGDAVANTISSVVNVPADQGLLKVLMAAMLGAVIWNLITWRLGFPSSSTHALVGGLVGAVWIARGSENILWGFNELFSTSPQLHGMMKIFAALFLSPVLGFVAAFVIQKFTNLLLRNAKFGINSWIKRLQWVISALLAYSHGSNDTQKVVGILTMAIAASNVLNSQIQTFWLKLIAGSVIFAGTMLGGWPIMKTIGRGIYTVRPIHSLNSQIASGAGILLATVVGAPVSTTHVVVGTVAGVGAADEFRMVNWNISKEIIVAWLVTIPASAAVAALVYFLLSLL